MSARGPEETAPDPRPALALAGDFVREAALAGLKAELDGLSLILAFATGRIPQVPAACEDDFDNMAV